MKRISYLLLVAASPVMAGELIYTPVNPSFGGSPLNGAWMQSSASAQNTFKDPNAPGNKTQTPLQRFNERLQNSILDRVANAITKEVVDENGDLKPGVIDTGGFRVTVLDNGDGTVTIITLDKSTGETSRFDILQTNSII